MRAGGDVDNLLVKEAQALGNRHTNDETVTTVPT
jgi:hypothetical protein